MSENTMQEINEFSADDITNKNPYYHLEVNTITLVTCSHLWKHPFDTPEGITYNRVGCLSNVETRTASVSLSNGKIAITDYFHSSAGKFGIYRYSQLDTLQSPPAATISKPALVTTD
jgi:hypothetical protein